MSDDDREKLATAISDAEGFLGDPSARHYKIADQIIAGNFGNEPESVLNHKSEGPEDGHTFDIRVRVRGSSSVMDGPKRDAKWWGSPWKIKVRAWDLPAALKKASLVPLDKWGMPDE